jgi:hypothetical protein
MMSKEHNIISGEGGCTIPVPMVGQRSCRGLVLDREFRETDLSGLSWL